jgi:hypothetical protein
MRYRSVVLTLALATGAISQLVLAATASTSLSVSATVVSNCQASVSPSQADGPTQGRPAPITSVVTVMCNVPTPYSLDRSTQTNLQASGSVSERQGANLASGNQATVAGPTGTTMIIVTY